MRALRWSWLLVVGAGACSSSSASPPPDDAPPGASSGAAERRVSGAPAPTGRAAEGPGAPACPADMVEVRGRFCPAIEQPCVEQRRPWQCARFGPSRCEGEERALRFCIDRFEFPNRRGAVPEVMVSWLAAEARCADLGKRLCTEDEWTLACEGPERWPFPYGHVRDATRCNIDKPTRYVELARLFDPFTQPAELARVDQREPSGARGGCVSPYGVHDMTGNVDEWVVNETGRPHRSSLKGGNWEQHRNACRPATRGHQPGFSYYPTGFRCCREARPSRGDAGDEGSSLHRAVRKGTL